MPDFPSWPHQGVWRKFSASSSCWSRIPSDRQTSQWTFNGFNSPSVMPESDSISKSHQDNGSCLQTFFSAPRPRLDIIEAWRKQPLAWNWEWTNQWSSLNLQWSSLNRSIFTCNLLVLLWRIKLCSLCLRKISGKRVPWRYDTFNERSSNHLRTFFFLLSVHGRHFMLYTLWFWSWTIIRLKKPCCTSIIFIIGIIIVFHERVSFSRVSHGIHLVTWKQSVVRSVQTSRRRGPTLSKDIA